MFNKNRKRWWFIKQFFLSVKQSSFIVFSWHIIWEKWNLNLTHFFFLAAHTFNLFIIFLFVSDNLLVRSLCLYIYICFTCRPWTNEFVAQTPLFFSLSLSVFILIICMHTSYLIIKRIKTMCTFIIIILFEINSLIDFNHFFSIKDKNLFD